MEVVWHGRAVNAEDGLATTRMPDHPKARLPASGCVSELDLKSARERVAARSDASERAA
jgi:hypothetical protein